MTDAPVLFVSAGLTRPKKNDHPLARKHLYLNYGCLGLASILADREYRVRMYHGRFLAPDELLDRCESEGFLTPQFPIMLSIPSCYAIPWASEFCRAVKLRSPRSRIVVGGRWVLGEDSAWLKAKIPQFDLGVYGTADTRIEDLLYPKRWSSIASTDHSNDLKAEAFTCSFPDIHYSVMDGYSEYQPSIEASRGCGMGCSFCSERNIPLAPLHSPSAITDKMCECLDLYGTSALNFYLEASHFRPNRSWASRFAEQYHARGLCVKWRCETRVEAFSHTTLDILAGAGLRVIDLGLESADEGQLLRMQKTRVPRDYLAQASALLEACRANDIWVKVNVLLWPGETLNTVQETTEWLEHHRECIKGISAGPVVVFGHDSATREFAESLSVYGAALTNDSDLDEKGYAHLHLSRTIDHGAALDICHSITKGFMTHEDYFDLKSFSYFPRNFSHEDFLSLIRESDREYLPFHVASI